MTSSRKVLYINVSETNPSYLRRSSKSPISSLQPDSELSKFLSFPVKQHPGPLEFQVQSPAHQAVISTGTWRMRLVLSPGLHFRSMGQFMQAA
jgi:hypothetical protein